MLSPFCLTLWFVFRGTPKASCSYRWGFFKVTTSRLWGAGIKDVILGLMLWEPGIKGAPPWVWVPLRAPSSSRIGSLGTIEGPEGGLTPLLVASACPAWPWTILPCDVLLPFYPALELAKDKLKPLTLWVIWTFPPLILSIEYFVLAMRNSTKTPYSQLWGNFLKFA